MERGSGKGKGEKGKSEVGWEGGKVEERQLEEKE